MKIFSAIVFIFFSSVLFAQNWQRVFTAPNVASAGFFNNENEGCIGTGYYTIGGPAQIFYTTDGGKSWTRAVLPNQQITGQVTDIFFRDRFNGWATIKSEPESGWTGIYKTNDGGRIWRYVYQAKYPTCIRETGRGIFVADRNTGILRSQDGGKTFTTVEAFSGSLGIDFLDDNIGIHSGESISTSPVMITTDGGTSWQQAVVGREAWTPFADPVNRRMFYASERDNAWPPTESTIGMTADNGATFSNPKNFSGDGITGGIAGSHTCRSVVYVQGQDTNASRIRGLLRSTDNGNNWVNVGGPSNFNDTRFAVTGRGAVVYAFDKFGGVWKTTSGGDGILSSSVKTAFLIRAPLAPVAAKLCDSATIRIPVRFTGCDQIRITNISYDEELTLVKAPVILSATAPAYDTLILRYHPQQVGPETKQIRVSFLQSDVVAEDTLIAVNVEGLVIPDKPLITTSLGSRTLTFGSISICGGDSSDIITISNTGCAPMRVNTLTISNPAFSLLSTFRSFTLDPGTSRKFLIYFKPQFATNYAGTVNVKTSFGADSISIAGAGMQGSRALRLVQPLMEATLCDTPEYILILRNISCSVLALDSLSIDPPFKLLTSVAGISLATDSTIALRIRLIPKTVGPFTQMVRIYSTIKGERFDTTLAITAVISTGTAVLSLQNDVIDFGDVSTCSFAEGTITIANTGCDSLRGSISQSSGSDFTLTSPASIILAKDGSTTFTFLFKPTQVGPQTSTFAITTNGGVRTITLRGVGIDGSGTVQGFANDIGSVLTCRDTTFTMRLINLACDTVFFDSLVISGSVSDYSISPPLNASLAVSDTLFLPGLFSPSIEGQRPATVILYFHSRSGSLYEVSVPLNGGGFAPPVLTLSMPPNSILAQAGKQIALPVDLRGATALPINTLAFKVRTNSDFVELVRFDLSAQFASVATVAPLNINRDTAQFIVHFNVPTIIQNGKLGDLYGSVFLTDTTEATLGLMDFTIADSGQSMGCLLSSLDTSIAYITLDPKCGDIVISKFLKNRDGLVEIAGISPNPTTGQLYVSLRVPTIYRGSATVEVLDVQGRNVYHQFIGNCKTQTIPLVIQAPSGNYLLRVVSAGGVVTRSLQIVH